MSFFKPKEFERNALKKKGLNDAEIPFNIFSLTSVRLIIL